MSLKVQDKFGPGIWFCLHLNAACAQTNIQKQVFVEQVTMLGEHFPCENCKKHFNKYITEHPISNYMNVENGLFRWTWEFHESVNKRLGKKGVSFEEALSKFTSTNAICTDECGEDEVQPQRFYTITSYERILNGYR